jgi:hypothetical protein
MALYLLLLFRPHFLQHDQSPVMGEASPTDYSPTSAAAC